MKASSFPPISTALSQNSMPSGPVIRIHAGLEDAGDLIADLNAGLARYIDAK